MKRYPRHHVHCAILLAIAAAPWQALAAGKDSSRAVVGTGASGSASPGKPSTSSKRKPSAASAIELLEPRGKVPSGRIAFAWKGPEDAPSYDVQLFAVRGDKLIEVTSHANIVGTAVDNLVDDLPPGRYRWRVAVSKEARFSPYVDFVVTDQADDSSGYLRLSLGFVSSSGNHLSSNTNYDTAFAWGAGGLQASAQYFLPYGLEANAGFRKVSGSVEELPFGHSKLHVGVLYKRWLFFGLRASVGLNVGKYTMTEISTVEGDDPFEVETSSADVSAMFYAPRFGLEYRLGRWIVFGASMELIKGLSASVADRPDAESPALGSTYEAKAGARIVRLWPLTFWANIEKSSFASSYTSGGQTFETSVSGTGMSAGISYDF